MKSTFAIRTAQANGRRMLKALITESHIRLRTYQRRIEEHRNTIFTPTDTSDAKLLLTFTNYISAPIFLLRWVQVTITLFIGIHPMLIQMKKILK
jgi:hypothetical protein